MIGRREIRARSECELFVSYNVIIRLKKKDFRAKSTVVVLVILVLVVVVLGVEAERPSS